MAIADSVQVLTSALEPFAALVHTYRHNYLHLLWHIGGETDKLVSTENHPQRRRRPYFRIPCGNSDGDKRCISLSELNAQILRRRKMTRYTCMWHRSVIPHIRRRPFAYSPFFQVRAVQPRRRIRSEVAIASASKACPLSDVFSQPRSPMDS